MKHKISLFVICTLFSIQCNTAREGAKSAAEDERIIRQGIETFSRDLVAGNFEAITQAYTPDAKIFPPGLDILQKHEAIRKYWTPGPDRKSRTVHHKITPSEIEITGAYAYDWGYYEGRTRQEDGSEQPWRGKYVIVWKRTAPGVWKIYLDAWNRIQ
jgi:ketosteroid isomerase-like protein